MPEGFELTDAAATMIGVFCFVVGSMIGSFLNVCVYRLPRGMSVVKPRSKCPKCDSPIPWYDNVPILSWLLLGAKCRNCGQLISWHYPMVEALTGALFVAVYWRFGLVAATPVYMAYAAAMVLVTFVDLTDWTIPNEVTMPGIPIGILLALAGMVYPESGLLLQDPLWAIIAAFAGGAFLYALDKASLLILGKRGMGFGDVKLIALVGAFFGVEGVVVTIVFASFIGSAVGVPMIMLNRARRTAPAELGNEDVPPLTEDEGAGGEAGGEAALEGNYLPFGPYLAAGSLVYLFVGPEIVETYFAYLQSSGGL